MRAGAMVVVFFEVEAEKQADLVRVQGKGRTDRQEVLIGAVLRPR